MNAATMPFALTGPNTPRTFDTAHPFAFCEGRASAAAVTLTVPMRCAFAVVAAVQAKRHRSTYLTDLDVDRARLGRATQHDRGDGWHVNSVAAVALERIGLIAVWPRVLGGVKLYDHAVLTVTGSALLAKVVQLRHEVANVGLGEWDNDAATTC